MDERGEDELIAACRHGDQDAYGQLMDRHGRRVFAVCLGVLAHAHDAEDAAQEAFVRGFEQIGRLRKREQFGAWITRIARNVSIDTLRRRGRSREILDHQARSNETARENHPDLESAIRRLPLELRLPLVMYYFDGRSADNIAESLGVSRRSAYQRLRQARQELHRLLTKEIDHE